MPPAPRILLVGAGGLACEVLKNLVAFDISHLSICDFDKVEHSNLNRQFLYAQADVSRYKAEVAAAKVRALAQNRFTVSAHVAYVQDLAEALFADHDVVVAALDSISARSYLSQLCVAHKKPLIDGGSTGFNGQALLLWAAAGTECYSCSPKPRTREIPACSVRGVPHKPQDCVIWAKFFCSSPSATSCGSSVTSFRRRSERQSFTESRLFEYLRFFKVVVCSTLSHKR
uniref:NEDD8-activating enzyme E1 catalytic subunit n=1 Tax=Dermatophagoides pteronyssinus TaxID=6956 RepID=A0A6P6Y7L0_DERPT|nr:SUMO-activating enzyme subunit 2-like [Dermatophagoides pteronyssinus]